MNETENKQLRRLRQRLWKKANPDRIKRYKQTARNKYLAINGRGRNLKLAGMTPEARAAHKKRLGSRWKKKNPDRLKLYRQRQLKHRPATLKKLHEDSATLSDSYLKGFLSQQLGVPERKITGAMMAAKREQLLLFRLRRKGREAINGTTGNRN